jgi:hypothetical protein
MITKIGICAGQILSFLEGYKNKVSVGALFEKIDSPYAVILMALGWLAREGYVRIHGADSTKMYSTDFLKASVLLQKASKEIDGQN